MESQIVINWPAPGDWARFIVNAEWRDGRWSGRRSTRGENVTPEQLAVLQGVITDIRALGEPWTATHAVARLSSPADRATEATTEGTPAPSTEPDAVELTLYARRDSDGASGMFTREDIPALLVQTADAVAAYNSFINPNQQA